MKSNSLKPKVEKKLNDTTCSLVCEPASGTRDHIMYNIYYKGVKVGILQISHGSKEFGKPLIGTMARQLGISSQDLINLEKCTFWGKDFIAKSRLLVGINTSDI